MLSFVSSANTVNIEEVEKNFTKLIDHLLESVKSNSEGKRKTRLRDQGPNIQLNGLL